MDFVQGYKKGKEMISMVNNTNQINNSKEMISMYDFRKQVFFSTMDEAMQKVNSIFEDTGTVLGDKAKFEGQLIFISEDGDVRIAVYEHCYEDEDVRYEVAPVAYSKRAEENIFKKYYRNLPRYVQLSKIFPNNKVRQWFMAEDCQCDGVTGATEIIELTNDRLKSLTSIFIDLYTGEIYGFRRKVDRDIDITAFATTTHLPVASKQSHRYAEAYDSNGVKVADLVIKGTRKKKETKSGYATYRFMFTLETGLRSKEFTVSNLVWCLVNGVNFYDFDVAGGDPCRKFYQIDHIDNISDKPIGNRPTNLYLTTGTMNGFLRKYREHLRNNEQ